MDDVHFLKQHAAEESTLFVVDSRSRDAAVWPSPSEYEVQFGTPFRNVVSVDLIDAHVPRTEYLVERGRNALDLALLPSATSLVAGTWRASPEYVGRMTAVVEPGDYNLDGLVRALNRSLTAAAGNASPAVQVAAVSSPAELTNRVRLECSRPFALFMGTSTIRHTLGFGDPVTPAGIADGRYAAVQGWSQWVNEASDVFVAVQRTGGQTLAAAFDGPAVPLDVAVLGAGQSVAQSFDALAGGALAGLRVTCSNQGAGNVTLTAVLLDAADAPLATAGPAAVTSSSPTDLDLAWSASPQIAAGDAYTLTLTAGGTGALGVWVSPSNAPTGGTGTTGLPADAEACAAVTVQAASYAVETPGLVDLTGERHVVVRCPEVEANLHRDRAFEKHFAGIGIVKMGGFGYLSQRTDFVSFPPRRFHPIGKLQKLTIRLERTDGTLYLAHGCDHTLTLVIRYYSQPAADLGAAARAALNPGYQPDLRQFMVSDKWAIGE